MKKRILDEFCAAAVLAAEQERTPTAPWATSSSALAFPQRRLWSPRPFLVTVRERAEARLPAGAPRLQGRLRFSLMQLYSDDPRLHYEVWIQRKTGRIEVGLHFEGESETNHRWAEALGRRVLELKARLGPGVELEEWTRSWTRLHQTLPLRKLDDDLAEEVAALLARFIEVMEPILAEGAA